MAETAAGGGGEAPEAQSVGAAGRGGGAGPQRPRAGRSGRRRVERHADALGDGDPAGPPLPQEPDRHGCHQPDEEGVCAGLPQAYLRERGPHRGDEHPPGRKEVFPAELQGDGGHAHEPQGPRPGHRGGRGGPLRLRPGAGRRGRPRAAPARLGGRRLAAAALRPHLRALHLQGQPDVGLQVQHDPAIVVRIGDRAWEPLAVGLAVVLYGLAPGVAARVACVLAAGGGGLLLCGARGAAAA
mmetsp:Transcript_113066/g.350980  ORF Transcript_113066/g.350980 Transcript_113066/m.350980 type:complete len:241 (-) Transcript_113066:947-1669(-)